MVGSRIEVGFGLGVGVAGVGRVRVGGIGKAGVGGARAGAGAGGVGLESWDWQGWGWSWAAAGRPGQNPGLWDSESYRLRCVDYRGNRRWEGETATNTEKDAQRYTLPRCPTRMRECVD